MTKEPTCQMSVRQYEAQTEAIKKCEFLFYNHCTIVQIVQQSRVGAHARLHITQFMPS